MIRGMWLHTVISLFVLSNQDVFPSAVAGQDTFYFRQLMEWFLLPMNCKGDSEGWNYQSWETIRTNAQAIGMTAVLSCRDAASYALLQSQCDSVKCPKSDSGYWTTFALVRITDWTRVATVVHWFFLSIAAVVITIFVTAIFFGRDAVTSANFTNLGGD